MKRLHVFLLGLFFAVIGFALGTMTSTSLPTALSISQSQQKQFDLAIKNDDESELQTIVDDWIDNEQEELLPVFNAFAATPSTEKISPENKIILIGAINNHPLFTEGVYSIALAASTNSDIEVRKASVLFFEQQYGDRKEQVIKMLERGLAKETNLELLKRKQKLIQQIDRGRPEKTAPDLQDDTD